MVHWLGVAGKTKMIQHFIIINVLCMFPELLEGLVSI